MMKQNQPKTLIQENIENRILHGIACEWEAALWILDEPTRMSMKKPLFSLGDLSSQLGNWSFRRNEIRISRQLVLHHPWDAVREVLLHEMAHQMADQVFCAKNEPPHGPAFLKACQFLRADPKTSSRYRPLDERVFGPADSDDDNRLRRIKKLMALAESKNPHEAYSAMAKAHELMGKYNIRLLETLKNRSYHSVFLGTPRLRHTRDEYHLARLLCDFYFVDGIWVSAYVIEKAKMGRVLEITGTQSNIKIAAYVYDFVQQHIRSQWEAYHKRKQLNHHRKTDFAVGIIEGFSSKLKSQLLKSEALAHDGDQSLITLEDPLLKRYMAYKYPRIQHFSRQADTQDHIVVRDGEKVGRSMVIFKGISEKIKTNNIFKIDT